MTIPDRIGRTSRLMWDQNAGQGVSLSIDVADDLEYAGSRLKKARLSIHLSNLTIADELEVTLNGAVLA